ncbi:SDR family NAD(P)-dependent oxidoreductase [Lactococcus garvieae]|uniref:Oxidoreductase n=1 Tax=Lactococcus garvieae DCC43 TaxID=1231377 RepID=K2QEV4_9LACT|nr:SDR family NAD(P)-dependent oxidoreductase [Lactococcus garvieae]EKF51942.1 oxidoreductase [Lactococcus garvieae DCC43]
MKKKLIKRNIVITGASGDIAQALIQRLQNDNLFLLSRLLPQPELPERIDILINNAGFGQFERLENLTDEQIEEMFKVNTLDLIKLTRDLQPQLQLINIASIAGKLPTAKSTVYAASKAAVLAFSDALRLENPKLIVTTVNTGPVKTKFHKNNKAYLEKVGKNAISAEYVAKKIEKILGKNKREMNLPLQLAAVAKLRAVFPAFVDYISNKFFNYK